MNVCNFGCGHEGKYFFKSTQRWCCSESVNSCPAKRERDSRKKQGKIPNWTNGCHPRGMKGKISHLKGKKFIDVYGHEKALEIGKKISLSLTGKPFAYKTKETASENSNRAREKILHRYEQGWMPRAGRCKKITYESQSAGVVKLDGSWELIVAKWLDARGYAWQRNIVRFEYLNPLGKLSHYTPDFFVKEGNEEYFIEVKGYETALDKCKWSQFSHKLIVMKRDEVKQAIKDLETYSRG